MDGETKRVMRGRASLRLRVFAAVLLVLLALQVFSAEKVYADELYYIRDDNIDFYLPDGWDVEEAAPEESSGSSFELISSSHGDGVIFDLYYHLGETAEPIYFNSSNGDAEMYYETQGRELIESFYSEKYPGEQVTVAEPELADTEWDTYLKLRVTVENGADREEQLIYFSARSSANYSYEDETISVVDRILLFRNEQGETMTADQLDEWAAPIASGYYDFGYDDILMGDVEDSSLNDNTYYSDSESDLGRILSDIASVVMPLLIVVVIFIVIFAVKRRARKRQMSYPKARWQQTGLSPGTQDRKRANKDEAERRNPKKPKKKREKDGGEKRRDVGSAVRRDVKGSNYIKSLETLKKSGLVTREEMQELMDKYERDMRELKRRRRRR